MTCGRDKSIGEQRLPLLIDSSLGKYVLDIYDITHDSQSSMTESDLIGITKSCFQSGVDVIIRCATEETCLNDIAHKKLRW